MIEDFSEVKVSICSSGAAKGILALLIAVIINVIVNEGANVFWEYLMAFVIIEKRIIGFGY